MLCIKKTSMRVSMKNVVDYLESVGGAADSGGWREGRGAWGAAARALGDQEARTADHERGIPAFIISLSNWWSGRTNKKNRCVQEDTKIGKIAEIRGQEKERAKVGKDANKRFFTISHWSGAGAWRGERHISCCLWLRCCQVAERTYRMYIQKVAPILALFFLLCLSLYYDFSSSSPLYSRSSDSHSCQIIKREV